MNKKSLKLKVDEYTITLHRGQEESREVCEKGGFFKRVARVCRKTDGKNHNRYAKQKTCESVRVLYSDKLAKILARLGKIRTQTTNPNPKTNRPTLRRFCQTN